MVQSLNHQGTEKFMVDFLSICGATGSCCDKIHKSMTGIWVNLLSCNWGFYKGWTLKFLSIQLVEKKKKEEEAEAKDITKTKINKHFFFTTI